MSVKLLEREEDKTSPVEIPFITGDSEGEWKPEFAAEFNRRLQAIRNGTAKLIRLN
ncbi:MAG: hypothetical protein QM523_04765 [Candidatus Pacebacteria bacterium]|nr:hypothetical protein [Candidatus Paceibacterota bacterium]